MRNFNPERPQARAALLAGWATLGVTAAHHAYGGVLYHSHWRLHGAAVAIVIGVALFLAYRAYRRQPDTTTGRIAGWILAAGVLLFPVAVIGGFEGFYNHGVKDALFLAGAPRSLLSRLFPPPTYELPNDLVFEVSGVLQVVPALYAARASLRFLRALAGPRPRASLA